jgi:rhodanese-related sulfurtransferase
MFQGLAWLVAIGLVVWIALRIREIRDNRILELHSITPAALRELMRSKEQVLIYDVRQPLDLLADSEIIPGAIRIDPQEIQANPNLISKDQDSIAYCTCPSDKTARMIVKRALKLQFFRVKFLKGGLAAWKASGFPVEPYTKSFHLDSAV